MKSKYFRHTMDSEMLLSFGELFTATNTRKSTHVQTVQQTQMATIRNYEHIMTYIMAHALNHSVVISCVHTMHSGCSVKHNSLVVGHEQVCNETATRSGHRGSTGCNAPLACHFQHRYEVHSWRVGLTSLSNDNTFSRCLVKHVTNWSLSYKDMFDKDSMPYRLAAVVISQSQLNWCPTMPTV